MRSSEANRVSSCSFADRVASASIAAYRAHCPLELQSKYKQTVVAAILLSTPCEPSLCAITSAAQVQNQRLTVLSIGVGTKALSLQCLREEKRRQLQEVRDGPSNFGAGAGRLIRDCHAEVSSIFSSTYCPWLVSLWSFATKRTRLSIMSLPSICSFSHLSCYVFRCWRGGGCVAGCTPIFLCNFLGSGSQKMAGNQYKPHHMHPMLAE